MRAVLAPDNGTTTLWTAYGLNTACSLIADGTLPNLSGATGQLDFDQNTHTTILHTTYILWTTTYGGREAVPMSYISTDGSDGSLSTQLVWEWEAIVKELDPVAGSNVDHQLPDMTDRWAVVISPSTTWTNYRHQADALAIYQLLRHHGYDDDHIVLIVEDNLADDPLNAYPGEIYIDRSADSTLTDPLVSTNVRKNAVIDYHFSDLAGPDDLADILQGRSSDRLPHVIHPTATDNVFIFWSGHGSDNGGPLWGDEDSREPFGTKRIFRIVEQMEQPRQFRRMMLVLESCYSGLWGEALMGFPDVLVLTAANAYETSKADIYDNDLRTYLSNAFSRSFLRAINANPSVSVADLYYSLARTTSGSHVTLYNIWQYGSAITNTMGDYFKSEKVPT